MKLNPIDAKRAVFEQRRREGSAKIAPLLSFIVMCLALIAFLAATFLTHTLDAKVFIMALGILLMTAEWIYTIFISNRWQRDIAERLLAEADAQHALEVIQQMTYEVYIDQDRQRWQEEIARRRWQRQVRQQGVQ
jgi:hypothetical protein